MRRLVVIVLVLGLVGSDGVAVAASRARVCRQACAQVIAGCIADGGRPRRCRRTAVRLCKRQGTTACLVPPTTTRPPTTVVTTTTSSTTTTQPRGLAGLLGTWDFTYSIVSTFEDRYVMSSVQTSDTGVPFILAYDVYDGLSDAVVARPADLGFSSFPFEFALLDLSTFFCDFFVFNKTGTNAVSGQYYLTGVEFDGSCGAITNPNDPYPMSGVRIAAPVVAGVTNEPAEGAMDGLVRALLAVQTGR